MAELYDSQDMSGELSPTQADLSQATQEPAGFLLGLLGELCTVTEQVMER